MLALVILFRVSIPTAKAQAGGSGTARIVTTFFYDINRNDKDPASMLFYQRALSDRRFFSIPPARNDRIQGLDGLTRNVLHEA